MAKTTKVQLTEFAADDLQSQVPDPVNGPAGLPVGAQPSDGEPSQTIDPRMAYTQGILNVIRGLTTDQLAGLFADMMPYNNPNGVPTGGTQASTPNMATLAPGADTSGMGSTPMPRLGEGVVRQEDLDALFESSGLSKEFQEKARIIFETVVAEKQVLVETSVNAVYQSKFEAAIEKLEEDMKTTVTELVEGVDNYLQLVVETWLNENEIAIESGIKAQIGESVLAGLKSLAEDHSVVIKETSQDIVADLSRQVTEMNAKFNDVVNKNVALQNENVAFKKNKIIEELGASLSKTQVDKLKTMVEDVDFASDEAFRTRITVLKETFITKPTAKRGDAEKILNEEVNLDQEPVNSLPPLMNKYLEATTRATHKI